MKSVLIILVVFFSFIISACASFGPAFISSSDKDAALVTFINKSGGINLAVSYLEGEMDGCACSLLPPKVIGIFHNKAGGVSGHADYADGGKNTDTFNVRVPANGNAFRLFMTAPNYEVDNKIVKTTVCQVHQSFVPEKNSKYQVIYNYYKNSCEFSIYKIVNNNKLAIPVNNYQACLVNSKGKDWLSNQIRERCESNKLR